MLYKTIHYSLLLGAGFAAVACAGNSAVKNPAQAPSETSGAPATINKGGSSVGTSGAAQERTPQQMDQWEKDHPRTAPEKEVPFMPTEKDYWEKKKAADTKSDAHR